MRTKFKGEEHWMNTEGLTCLGMGCIYFIPFILVAFLLRWVFDNESLILVGILPIVVMSYGMVLCLLNWLYCECIGSHNKVSIVLVHVLALVFTPVMTICTLMDDSPLRHF